MRRFLLSALACPGCRTHYDLTEHEAAGESVSSGFLTCRSCAIVIPIVCGFPLFTEPMLHAGQASRAGLAAIKAQLFGSTEDYLEYRRTKLERGQVEVYAAFQPFNESTRAFEPALAAFASGLKPGDLILDPWCRSGWSAFWLASLFPEQTIVALWQGQTSVLGYRGFAHWFADAVRPANVEVMFGDPERALPFASQTFAGIYALDAFHRFSPTPFAGELMRTAQPTAHIVLAHLHLSNSEPEPYFDRGGTIWHGRDYRAWLDGLAERQGRKGQVFSEADLFEREGEGLPAEAADTSHYNGFVLIGPVGGEQTAGTRPAPLETRWLLNPLFRILFSRRAARVDGSLHDGAVSELLSRHPIYVNRLPKAPVALGDLQLALLALAVTGHTDIEAAASLGLEPDKLAALAEPLDASELLRRTGVGSGGVAMQRFHANQLPGRPRAEALQTVLATLFEAEGPVVNTSDGGAISGAEVMVGVNSFAAYLGHAGLNSGDNLAVADTRHPLTLILVLAALALGLNVNLGVVGAFKADLVIDERGGSGAIALGLEDDATDSILAWIGSREDWPSVTVHAGGHLRLAIDGRIVGLGIDILAEAALSLASYSDDFSGPIDGFGDFFGFFMCLTQFAKGRSITLRN